MFTFCFILSKIKNNVKKSSNNQTKISKDSQMIDSLLDGL